MNIPNNVTLSVLIWHYASPARYCIGTNHGESVAVRDAYKFLNSQELIQDIGPTSKQQWELTDKGRFYVEHLRSIPLPTEKTVWQIPDLTTEPRSS